MPKKCDCSRLGVNKRLSHFEEKIIDDKFLKNYYNKKIIR